jgi:hypothetical protein
LAFQGVPVTTESMVGALIRNEEIECLRYIREFLEATAKESRKQAKRGRGRKR